jgi:hypothetical protein
MYYPKSQIKTDLYTYGEEYILSTTNKFYQGYYYEVSNGKKYTGKFPQDGPNILLIVPRESQYVFNTKPDSTSTTPQIIEISLEESPSFLINNPLSTRYIPQFIPTLPTNQDKQNGQFIRYFCKKNNELKYFEIDKLTYDKLISRDNQIAWDLYSPASFIWRIKGNQEQVFNSNKGAAISLERNLRWPGFSQYFRDKFLQYYLES